MFKKSNHSVELNFNKKKERKKRNVMLIKLFPWTERFVRAVMDAQDLTTKTYVAVQKPSTKLNCKDPSRLGKWKKKKNGQLGKNVLNYTHDVMWKS